MSAVQIWGARHEHSERGASRQRFVTFEDPIRSFSGECAQPASDLPMVLAGDDLVERQRGLVAAELSRANVIS